MKSTQTERRLHACALHLPSLVSKPSDGAVTCRVCAARRSAYNSGVITAPKTVWFEAKDLKQG